MTAFLLGKNEASRWKGFVTEQKVDSKTEVTEKVGKSVWGCKYILQQPKKER